MGVCAPPLVQLAGALIVSFLAKVEGLVDGGGSSWEQEGSAAQFTLIFSLVHEILKQLQSHGQFITDAAAAAAMDRLADCAMRLAEAEVDVGRRLDLTAVLTVFLRELAVLDPGFRRRLFLSAFTTKTEHLAQVWAHPAASTSSTPTHLPRPYPPSSCSSPPYPSLPPQTPSIAHKTKNKTKKHTTPGTNPLSDQVLASYGEADPIPFFRDACERITGTGGGDGDADFSFEGKYFALRALSLYCSKQSPMIHKVLILCTHTSHSFESLVNRKAVAKVASSPFALQPVILVIRLSTQ